MVPSCERSPCVGVGGEQLLELALRLAGGVAGQARPLGSALCDCNFDTAGLHVLERAATLDEVRAGRVLARRREVDQAEGALALEPRGLADLVPAGRGADHAGILRAELVDGLAAPLAGDGRVIGEAGDRVRVAVARAVRIAAAARGAFAEVDQRLESGEVVAGGRGVV